jgi:hypothetical protein
MKSCPYDESPEWVPREYPAAQDHRAAQEGIGQPQRDAGHIDYPGVAPQQQPRQAQATQQTYAGYRSAATAPNYAARQQQARPASRGATAGSQKMSKANALELLDSLKKSIVIGAIIGFGVLSTLVATHAVGSAANQSQSTQGSNSISPDNNNNTNTNNNSNNPSNNGGFFQQQGGGKQHQLSGLLMDRDGHWEATGYWPVDMMR